MHSEIQSYPLILLMVQIPAAVVGVDENQAVLQFTSNPESSTSNIAQRENMQTDVTDNEALVKMVVMDGIVIGPQHCAFGSCTADPGKFPGWSILLSS